MTLKTSKTLNAKTLSFNFIPYGYLDLNHLVAFRAAISHVADKEDCNII